MEVSFQTLLARLRVASFHAYLQERGWELSDAPEAQGARYELPDGDAPYFLVLPHTDESSGRIALMQRALYHLCEVEDRQPRDIAADILAIVVQASVETPSSPTVGDATPQRLRILNDRTSPLEVLRPGDDHPTRLLPGEALEALVAAGEGQSLELRVGDARVVVARRD